MFFNAFRLVVGWMEERVVYSLPPLLYRGVFITTEFAFATAHQASMGLQVRILVPLMWTHAYVYTEFLT